MLAIRVVIHRPLAVNLIIFLLSLIAIAIPRLRLIGAQAYLRPKAVLVRNAHHVRPIPHYDLIISPDRDASVCHHYPHIPQPVAELIAPSAKS